MLERIDFVTAKDLSQIQQILRKFFGPTYYGADNKFMRWFYYDSPYKNILTKSDDCSILAAFDSGGKILALDAFLPWQTMFQSRKLTTVWDIEWLNASSIKGLGKKLVETLRTKTELYCGYGMNSLSKKAFQKLGYAMREEIERKVAILDAQKCNRLFTGSQAEADFLNSKAVKPALFSKIKYCEIENNAGLSNNYWQSHLERCLITSIKDSKAIKWRYLDHPYLKYHLIALSSKASEGFAVVRVEKIRGQAEKVLRLLELFPIKGTESALINAVIKFGLDQGAILADFFCVSSAIADQICPAPFISIAQHREYDIPMLFQPIEVRERKSINIVMDSNLSEKLLSFDTFFATKGDGDQDVCVNEDYKTVSL